MDLLHRKISAIGDVVYFIASSIEEPYYFVRFRGEIMEQTITDEYVTYRIKATDILESIYDIHECISNKRFRMKCVRNKTSHYLDKIIRGSDLSDTDLVKILLKRMQKNWFDISIMLTFQTQSDMDEKIALVNKFNIDKLQNRIEYLSKRSLSL